MDYVPPRTNHQQYRVMEELRILEKTENEYLFGEYDKLRFYEKHST